MNLNDINEWRSPEEVEQLRRTKHGWGKRFGLAIVFGPVFGILGALVFGDSGVFWPIAGLVTAVILLFDPTDI